MLTVKIIPNEHGTPPGKLADAELHFTESPEQHPLGGLKLIVFAIWERRTGGGRNVTCSFTLLRPIADTGAQDRIRDLILDAYAVYEEELAVRS